MPDTQIHPLGDEAAPAAYELPAAAEVRLKGAFARFDGSAAAGSFRPLLRIVSDAGTVALETEADVTVAAGGSADASWFPHVAAPAGGGIDFDQPNTDPLGAGGSLRIDTGLVEIGNVIPGDWQVTAIDYQWESSGPSGYDYEADGGDYKVNANTIAGVGGSVNLYGDRGVTLAAAGGSSFQVHASGAYSIANLPAADPGISGRLWNNAGVLSVSP